MNTMQIPCSKQSGNTLKQYEQTKQKNAQEREREGKTNSKQNMRKHIVIYEAFMCPRKIFKISRTAAFYRKVDHMQAHQPSTTPTWTVIG